MTQGLLNQLESSQIMGGFVHAVQQAQLDEKLYGLYGTIRRMLEQEQHQ
jgi:hypothetical protein